METLPPTIQLLLNEDLNDASSPANLAKSLDKGLLKELRAQAEYTINDWGYPDSTRDSVSGQFVVVPTGPLNPLSSLQKCNATPCRIHYAHAFAKTVALYSEYAVVPDIFSSLIMHYHGDLAFALFNELAVLNELLPLVKAGVLRFGRPGLFLCREHLKENEELVTEAARNLANSTIDSVRVTVHEGPGELDHYAFENPLVDDSGLTCIVPVHKKQSRNILKLYKRRGGGLLPNKAGKLLLPYLEERYREDVNAILIDLNLARLTHAQLTTGSRGDALLLKHVSNPQSKTEIENWEQMRSIRLPWIKELQVEEVLRLRDDAKLALERLRVLLRDRLAKEVEISNIAQELESEAIDIKAKMEAWKTGRGRQFELLHGALGISLIAYGVTHDLMLAAGAAVLTGTAAAFRDQKAERVETAKLYGRPGFALLRARDLLSHRKH